MVAAKEVCILDSDKAGLNYTSVDKEVKDLLKSKEENGDISAAEKSALQKLWDTEVKEAEVKARSLNKRELDFFYTLPQTQPYNGYSELYNQQTDEPQRGNAREGGFSRRPWNQENNSHNSRWYTSGSDYRDPPRDSGRNHGPHRRHPPHNQRNKQNRGNFY